MATIGRALQQVKGQLDQLVSEAQVQQLCRNHGYTWRNRVLGPALTVRLMLLQVLAQVALSGLRHVANLSVTAEAIRKAKVRLPVKVLYDLVRRVCPEGPALSTWHGLKVFLVDGTSFLTEDTPSLRTKYGKAKNGRGTSLCRPTPKLLAVFDLAGGFIHQVIPLPWSRQERVCLSRLFKACGKDAVILGDRGCGGFGQVALMLASGVHGCLRLPDWLVVHGRGKANHRLTRRLGKQDLLVTWKRGRRVKWMSKRRWEELPEALTLRQISFRITRKGFRTHWAWIVTTLTDPQKHPAGTGGLVLQKMAGGGLFQRPQIEPGFRETVVQERDGEMRQGTAVIRDPLQPGASGDGPGRPKTGRGSGPHQLHRRPALAAVVRPGRRTGGPDRQSHSPASEQPRMLKHGRRKYARLNRSRAALCKPRCEAKL